MYLKYVKPLLVICFLLLLYCIDIYAFFKKPITIKIAILDTAQNEMPLTQFLSEYERAYFNGIKTANYIAAQKGINIIYKFFTYGTKPLAILEQISKIKRWRPDLIIGPSASDKFTLLKNQFSDTIVISPYASGLALKQLPKNFYSIFLDDEKIMTLLAHYIHQEFPNKDIYIITEINSKQCVDASILFSKIYKKISPKTAVVNNKFILDDISNINGKILAKNHTKDVILIFNYTNYAYNAIIKHIINSSPKYRFIFFSDQDNWSNKNNLVDKSQTLPYESYRIGPLLPSIQSNKYRKFYKTYYVLYKEQPRYLSSYILYNTIMSVIFAIEKYPASPSYKTERSKIFYSYLLALKNNPFWYKLNEYGIYRLTSKGETLFKKLPNSSS